MSERFSGHDPQRGDTAGTPWEGRTLRDGEVEPDDGRADPDLLAALRRPTRESELVAAVAGARLLVPILAMPGAQASSDMAAVTLTAPDGRRALPVFSSVRSLGEWDEAARPVPVSAQRAALAAAHEGCSVMVLDPGSTWSVSLRGSMVWALAHGRGWRPAYEDPVVQDAVESAVAAEPAVGTGRALPGEGGALVVELSLAPGLGQDEVEELVRRVGQRIAADDAVRIRIDSIGFRLTSTS